MSSFIYTRESRPTEWAFLLLKVLYETSSALLVVPYEDKGPLMPLGFPSLWTGEKVYGSRGWLREGEGGGVPPPTYPIIFIRVNALAEGIQMFNSVSLQWPGAGYSNQK